MATMQVELVSAERELFSGEAAEVYARSVEGEIGILPGHQPVLLALEIAPVRMKMEDGNWEAYAVHNGFMFFRQNRLVILADLAEHAEEIDVEEARELRERHAGTRREELDEEAFKALRRAEVRLEVAQGGGYPAGSV
ncbi:MAG: F0F1 ATP synthase subunit epsilon [Nitriliruptorales bacterium]